MFNLTEKDIVRERAKERFGWREPLATNHPFLRGIDTPNFFSNRRENDAYGFRWKLPNGRVVNIEVHSRCTFIGSGKYKARYILDIYIVQPNLLLYLVEKGVEVFA